MAAKHARLLALPLASAALAALLAMWFPNRAAEIAERWALVNVTAVAIAFTFRRAVRRDRKDPKEK